MDSVDRALVTETKALIKEVESGDTAHAAWVAIQDRLQQLYDGRSQQQVADLVERPKTWVRDVLNWDVRSATHTPFATNSPAGKRARQASNRAAAKKMMTDPVELPAVIEKLTEEERLEVAKAAMEPAMRDERRGHKEREAHRESKPASERGYIELISSLLDGADLNILRAIHKAGETTWDDAEVVAMAEGRIDRTAMRLDLLRMAVKSEGDIGAELSKIEELS